MTNANNTTMNIKSIFESAVFLSKSLEAIEQHETRVETKIKSNLGSEWTTADDLRRLDLIEAAAISEKIFEDTVRSTQQGGM